jgi:hypothetical protein
MTLGASGIVLRCFLEIQKSRLRKWSLQHRSLTTGDHMESNEDPGSVRREHKVTASLTQDAFDQMLSRLMGLPGGAHTKPTAVQAIDFYGHTTSFMIQTVKTDGGETAFVSQVSATGSVRFILPPRVLAVIDRQRVSLTKQVRRRNGKRIAEERAAAGIKPGFMK